MTDDLKDSKALLYIKEVMRRKELAKADDLPLGTVLRWRMPYAFGANHLFVAVKNDNGWFTSSSESNMNVKPFLKFDELIETLAKAQFHDIVIATDWMEITND